MFVNIDIQSKNIKSLTQFTKLLSNLMFIEKLNVKSVSKHSYNKKTYRKIFTVLKSPHVNKKAREQFQLCSYKRLLDIYSSTAKTVDALMKLELPSGVDVEIKV